MFVQTFSYRSTKVEKPYQRLQTAINRAFAVFCCLFLCLIMPMKSNAVDRTVVRAADNDTLIFVSDTQAPLFVETIIHRTPFNSRATSMIFNDILAKRPGNVFLLGDVVAAGSRPRRWAAVDKFLDSVRGMGGEAWGCLGNHEYIYQAKAGLKAFQQRFPRHSKTGYYVILDSVAVVLLNSNFSKLSAAEQSEQQQFYTQTLTALDKNDSVKAVIVACHHSPYSNSRVVGSNMRVRETFATPFMQSAKCRVFLSGHSHNFEHFKVEGKTFLVIGGGGGVSQHLNTGTGRIACEDEDCHPLFHYLMIKRHADKLHIICREISPDLKGFNDLLHIHVPIP